MKAAEKLEHARRLGTEMGLPLAGLDCLAVSLRTAARLLSVSHSQVEKLVARGELPAFRVGRSVRVELVEVVEFIERNRRVRNPCPHQPLLARAVDLIERKG